jgi:hypothetical protein
MNANRPDLGNVEIRPFFRMLRGLIFFFMLFASVILLLVIAFVPNAPRWELSILVLGGIPVAISSYRLWRYGHR